MKSYVFDFTLSSALSVTAETQEEAEAQMAEIAKHLDACTAVVNGYYCEVSLAGKPVLGDVFDWGGK
jgi:hypothetical protein